MSLSDDVREHCKVTYVNPARTNSERTVTICTGDVHRDMNYRNRYPLVCSAIGSNKFEKICNVKRISVEGPLNGANTLFTFEMI